MIISGLTESLSLASIIPFISLLSNPSSLFEFKIVKEFFEIFEIFDANELVIPLTILFSLIIAFVCFVRLINLRLSSMMAASIGTDISYEVYIKTLGRSYITHVKRNSSTLIAIITSQIGLTVSSINAFLQMITSFFVLIGIVSVLFIVNSSVAFSLILLFSISYLILGSFTKKLLKRNGKIIAQAQKDQVKIVQESLGAIRHIIMENSYNYFFSIYKQIDIKQRLSQANNRFLGASPRFILELIGILSLAWIGVALTLNETNSTLSLSTLGVMAFGAQRLLPSMQQIYSGWTTLKSYDEAMRSVLMLLEQPNFKIIPPVQKSFSWKQLNISNVSFSYNSGDKNILNKLDLKITRGQKIGIIGKTGSGKSTLIDLIMALLEPTSGNIFVDDRNLHDQKSSELIYSWQQTITHVPQETYLIDGTILQNIAFGESSSLVDINKAYKSAEQAQLLSFIANSTMKFDTLVGERGVRLSGGQKQRIGLARAFYKKSSFYIFDEATSALDLATEKLILNSINSIIGKPTIIMIAHRLSTLKNCDTIIKINSHDIVIGPPSQMLEPDQANLLQ